jgi:uncharacterized protein YodC (DUF2158 family)
MAKFNIGDLVVLKSGSMRMCVEECTDDSVSTVWCNEGVVGRDTFNPALINKWEFREDSRPGGDRGAGGGGRSHGADRDGGKPPYRGGDRKPDRGPARGGDGPPRKLSACPSPERGRRSVGAGTARPGTTRGKPHVAHRCTLRQPEGRGQSRLRILHHGR